jgi:DNA-binding response OmpR family regulator
MMSEERPVRARGKRVVLIDDDQIIRDLAALHLRNAGYCVFTAEDAVVGGREILRERPDVIICDVEMPFLDGYAFVAALKTHDSTQDIPVIFVSSRDDLKECASKLGAAAYLRKPVMSDRLLEVVALFTN